MKEKKTLEELIQDYNECKEIFGDADFTSIMIAEFICDTYCERKQYDKASEYADYSRVIAPVVADLCTTPVALSAPPNSFQNNSQS